MTLDERLSDLGHAIADHGIDQVPQVYVVAAAVRSIAPVVAGVLSSDDEPAVARDRAFLRAATLLQRLPSSEQARLMDMLVDQTTAPRTVVSLIPAERPLAPVLASVG